MYFEGQKIAPIGGNLIEITPSGKRLFYFIEITPYAFFA
jgi:hypothetical protein